MIGHASNQAIVVDRVGVGPLVTLDMPDTTHIHGQEIGESHHNETTHTNPASQPQASHHPYLQEFGGNYTRSKTMVIY
jgi:hypothetical protein